MSGARARALTPLAHHVLREGGTEPPFSGAYTAHTAPGTYACAGCGRAVFGARDKFASGCGWPAFARPVAPAAVVLAPDTRHGMERTEVRCGACDGHLGHVFDDGPAPDGARYCINSVALSFSGEE